jgi:hypothetical protein
LFFLTSDGRFLVSQYVSDSAGLAVFDLRTHERTIQSTEIPYIQNWYRDSSGYFFTESEWSGASGEPHEKQGVVYRLDLKVKKILKTTITSAALQSATRVKYDFDPRRHEDCVSR